MGPLSTTTQLNGSTILLRIVERRAAPARRRRSASRTFGRTVPRSTADGGRQHELSTMRLKMQLRLISLVDDQHGSLIGGYKIVIGDGDALLDLPLVRFYADHGNGVSTTTQLTARQFCVGSSSWVRALREGEIGEPPIWTAGPPVDGGRWTAARALDHETQNAASPDFSGG